MTARIGAASQSRRTVNIVSCLISLSVLFIAVQISDGSFSTRINRITENLDRAMFKIIDNGKAEYSEFVPNEDYKSNATFHPSGMAGLYNLTLKFMQLLMSENYDPSNFITIENHNVHINRSDLTQTILGLSGLITVLILILLGIVLWPLCGLFFCFCRCCGKCGARAKPVNKRHDLCKKIIETSLLIIFTTLFLFCVVCTFGSNQQIQTGIEGVPDSLDDSVRDANLYLDNTKGEMHQLLVENYKEFSDKLINTTDSSGEIVMDEIKSVTDATAMTNLSHVVNDNLGTINSSFIALKENTNHLRVYASQLNDAMRKLKRDLYDTLQQCELPTCGQIRDNITKLQTTIDFNKFLDRYFPRLPDVSDDLAYIEQNIHTAELQKAVNEGVAQLDYIQTNIQNKLEEALTEAKTKIREAGTTIEKNLKNVTDVVDKFQSEMIDKSNPIIKDTRHYIQTYSRYRYYIGLAISCVYLLISVFIAIGVTCGFCGKSPDGYSDNCCNKGTGSQFLICAVVIMFVSGFFIALATLITFSIGVASQRMVCYPLQHPNESHVLRLIDDGLDLSSTGMNITVRELLMNCHQNESAYRVFQLQNKFDIEQAVRQFNISDILDKLDLSDILNKPVTILSKTNLETLQKLAEFAPHVDFDKFRDELTSNFTTYSLSVLENELNNLIKLLENSNKYADLVSELQLSLVHVNAYNEKLLIPMNKLAHATIDTADNLNTVLTMGFNSFPEAIRNLTGEIQHAQDMLNTKGVQILEKVANDFKDNIKDQVNTYTERIATYTQEKIGKCGPLSTIINSTLVSTCDKVIIPWNGFWFSLLTSMLLFIPLVILSVKLATIYQKYKSYGPYVETEYLYDAYAERDSIPMNSRGGKRNKKKPARKHKRYEDRPQNMGGEVVAREYGPANHPPDTRYADMAPKQWEEFPAGGPPQYQRAPTEYDRPPPYYYPGTAENHHS